MGLFKKLFGGKPDETEADDLDDDETEEPTPGQIAEFQRQKADGSLAHLELFDEEPRNFFAYSSVNEIRSDGSGRQIMAIQSRGATIIDLASQTQLEHEFDGMYSGDLASDGKSYLFGSQRKRVFRAADGEELARSDKFGDALEYVRWLGTNNVFALDHQTQARVLGADTLETRADVKLSQDYDSVHGVAVAPDASAVYVAYGVHIVALRGTDLQALWNVEYEASAGRLAISPDGSRLATLGHDGNLAIYDANSGQLLTSVAVNQKEGIHYPGCIGEATTWTTNVSYSPDGRLIALSTLQGNLQLWDATATRALREVERQEGAAWIETLTFLANGNIAIGTSDEVVAVWQPDPLQRLHIFSLEEEDD